jgi:hypothetical protein
MAGEYNRQIIDTTGNPGYDGKIMGWQLKDAPQVSSYWPSAHIESQIRAGADSFNWDYPVEGHPWFHRGPKDHYVDYARIAQAKELWVYLYPTDSATTYTGYSGTAGVAWQSNLNIAIAEPCDSVRSAISQSDSLDGWVFTPQYWWCEADSGCFEDEQRRKPTYSEMLCQTFVGMCYHPKGIMFWKYNSVESTHNQGIVELDGTPDPELYNPIRDKINPYLKAIDSTYLGLTWERAYLCLL